MNNLSYVAKIIFKTLKFEIVIFFKKIFLKSFLSILKIIILLM